MLIIYHDADLDGICSGAIAHMKYPEARLLGHDYKRPFDIECVQPGEDVIMADISLPMPLMEQVAERSKSFLWLDHHVSAMKEYEAHFDVVAGTDNELGHKNLRYIYRPDISACEICWKEFFPGQVMPESVHMLGEYDTWRENGTDAWNNVILPFQYGMRMEGFTPESLANWIFNDYANNPTRLREMVGIGSAILKYQKQQDERLMLKSFDARLNIPAEQGVVRCLVCNGAYNSTAFESKWDEEKYDVMVGISFDGKMWGISLRTTKDIDLSVIAKSFGGGGHKQAAGCGVDDLRKILVW